MIRFLSTKRGGAIAFGTVAASPSGLSRLRRLRGVASTIANGLCFFAGVMFFVIGFPLVVWLALVVTP